MSAYTLVDDRALDVRGVACIAHSVHLAAEVVRLPAPNDVPRRHCPLCPVERWHSLMLSLLR